MRTNDIQKTIPTERGVPWQGMPSIQREAGVVEAKPGIIESTRLEPLEKPGQRLAEDRDVIEARPGIIESTKIEPLDKGVIHSQHEYFVR